MTDKTPTSSTPSQASAGATAGAQLRAARENRGMHIAALAAAIKVAPARLEALEADNLQSMPDVTFARALAQAVCRALKIDPVPVLAAMPESTHMRLERVDEGIKAPFREHTGASLGDGGLAGLLRHPVLWLAVLLLAGAAAFLWWPAPVADQPDVPPAGSEPLVPVPAASEPIVAPGAAASVAVLSEPTPQTSAASAVVGAAPAGPAASAAPAAAGSLPVLVGGSPAAELPAPAPGGEGLVLRAVQDSWVQVTGADGKVLIGRTLVAGETASFAGPLPLKVRIGNVAGTEAAFAGRPLDMRALTRDNTLRLTLPPPAETAAPAAPAAAATPAARPGPKPSAP